MPKMKTHRGAAKRLRRTAKGKFKFKRSGHRHNLSAQSKGARRVGRQNAYISAADEAAIKRLLPGG